VIVLHAGPLLTDPYARPGDATSAGLVSVVATARAIGLHAAAASAADLEQDRPRVSEQWRSGALPVLASNWSPPGPGGPLATAPETSILTLPSGLRVGVLALESPEATGEGHQGLETLVAVDPAQRATQLVPELRAAGAEIVVLLSNLGLRATRRLVRAAFGIDVAVVGSLGAEEPPRAQTIDREGQTLIAHAGVRASHLLALGLELRDAAATPPDARLAVTRWEIVAPPCGASDQGAAP
jgi:2',3'-cyclic-nucleotide 2'-phosphodiesterase (5'-nucleotidase family)